MKRWLEITVHVLGAASIATMFFATLFVGTLSNSVRVAATARTYRQAIFVVQRLAWNSGRRSGNAAGCWAVGVIGHTPERLSLNDCRWTEDRARRPEVTPGQEVHVLYSPSATEAQIQGEYVRVVYPEAIADPWRTVRAYAWKMYRPTLFVMLPMLLIMFAGRIAYGPGATAGNLYGVVCAAILGLQVVGFAAMLVL
jgi:hypothetical protein